MHRPALANGHSKKMIWPALDPNDLHEKEKICFCEKAFHLNDIHLKNFFHADVDVDVCSFFAITRMSGI